ncbi:DUF3095 domain-containing protein [Hoeflea prorocentri]|uniref:DUF3095 domain-containing protein n=1 Tax=Hoeflea prorocentri TaxID=1922333 RepID=A0A9X3ZG49_9HYPH|nr:DUF3095 domain-containing protein [Hoeflea prorocentri]MCY6379440.1 DUF3095 domain-containing protein [Hoeflea prorocentri]MDA5397241.1 DUF3095 domain-containing protein [Hoeflea prorocentri]
MSQHGVPDLPVLTRFEQVADGSLYARLPDDWQIGIADVVDSTGAIANGHYKSVNFAGAATISAVSNSSGGRLPLFAFGGDGAQFVVRPEQAQAASSALAQVSHWVKGQLELDLRVGMTSIAAIRAAGFDVRAAYWRASDHVQYSLFTGGGLEWAEKQLKGGHFAIRPTGDEGDPDLSGLSCQWGPVMSTRGKIISLIVKPASGSKPAAFEKATRKIIKALGKAKAVNPVPDAGPDVRWPGASIDLQSKTITGSGFDALKKAWTIVRTLFYWSLFKAAAPLRGLAPTRYRADISANSDFRKFNDGLMMTVDCSPGSIDGLKTILERAERDGVIRFGLHVQDEALITCVVPSVFERNHMHFIDGSGGGYASAAKQLRANGRS